MMWLSALRRYVVFTALANLIWELAQLPLYTIWYQSTPREIIFAALHCTGGDVLIASIALLTALVLVGRQTWPSERYLAVASLTILFGLGYTAFSEWLNTSVRSSWTYAEQMPVISLFEIQIGASPLLQWIVIPTAVFSIMRGRTNEESHARA